MVKKVCDRSVVWVIYDFLDRASSLDCSAKQECKSTQGPDTNLYSYWPETNWFVLIYFNTDLSFKSWYWCGQKYDLYNVSHFKAI